MSSNELKLSFNIEATDIAIAPEDRDNVNLVFDAKLSSVLADIPRELLQEYLDEL